MQNTIENPTKTPETNPEYNAKLESLEKQLARFELEALLQLKEFRRKFDRRFHLLYTLIAFIGITLVWYAVWTIVSDIPIISNPYVAGALGLIILLLLGKFFDRLV